MFIVECDSANDLIRSGLRSGTEDERKNTSWRKKRPVNGKRPIRLIDKKS